MGASVPTSENFRGGEWGSLWSGPSVVDEDISEFDPVCTGCGRLWSTTGAQKELVK
jgi:hypothetical protein